MKITQIMLAKGFGGAERSFVDLSKALLDHGHELQVICHRNFQGRDLLRAQGIDYGCINVHGSWDLNAVYQLRRRINAYHPDVVQAHLARGAHLTGKALARGDYPLVVKTHNYVNLKYYHRVDLLVATTGDQEQYLLHHGVPPGRICRIPNFCSLPLREKVAPPHFPTFLSYGRMVHKKGFHLLIEAFLGLSRRGLEARLIVGGEGPDMPFLANLVNKLGLGAKVRFPGWVADVSALHAQADFFVLPSLDEPFGIVLLEAMACSTPIIASRTQGPLEVLSEDTALLVNIGDAEGLEAAMVQALTRPQSMQVLSAAAARRFQEHYAASVVVPHYIAEYRRLCAEGRRVK